MADLGRMWPLCTPSSLCAPTEAVTTTASAYEEKHMQVSALEIHACALVGETPRVKNSKVSISEIVECEQVRRWRRGLSHKRASSKCEP